MTQTIVDTPVVMTQSGPVIGMVDGDAAVWRGMPFAAPPTGTRRFQRPSPPAPWNEPLIARDYGPAPFQPRLPAIVGGIDQGPMSEDCLTVNVARPRDAGPRSALPVMVWVYGGANQWGASEVYPGEPLAVQGDVVYVSFNYRLGAMGWIDFTAFSDESHEFDANLGLRDQIAALRWVRDNIADFGGDPDNVTLFGESAGATSVLSLMCAPDAHGLFHKTIVQSPAASIVMRRDRARRWARRFVSRLGATQESAAKRLYSASPEQLVTATEEVARDAAAEAPGTHLTNTVVDGDVLPEWPLDAFVSGAAADVPMIVGTTEREAAFFKRFVRNGGYALVPTTPDQIDLLFDLTDPDSQKRVTSAYPEYPRGDSIPRLTGDLSFWFPSVRLASAHSEAAPTWMYRFDYASPFLRLAGLGAVHGSEIDYVLGRNMPHGITGPLHGGGAARRLSRDVISLWARFAHESDPGRTWPRYDTASRSTLAIDRPMRIVDDPHAQQRAAWTGYRIWDDIA